MVRALISKTFVVYCGGRRGDNIIPGQEGKMAGTPEEISDRGTAEQEFLQKKARIKRYLTQEGGMDVLERSWDDEKWEHIGDDGSVKRVYRPIRGILAEEGVCLRENVSDQATSYRESATFFRPETQFLQRVNGPHFVRVYAHAPLSQNDAVGQGNYDASHHWEIVDFVGGTTVKRSRNLDNPGGVWPDSLTPAARLKVVLAACECEREATHLSPPQLKELLRDI